MKQDKIKWIGNILTIVALWFLIAYFKKLDIDLQILFGTKMLAGVLIGGMISFGSVLLSAWAWKNTVELFSGKKVSFHEAEKVYLQANLGKYIPGNIAHFVGRNIFAAKFGIGNTQAAMGTFLEIAGLLIAAVMFGLVLSFRDVCLMIQTFFSAKYAAGAVVLFIMGMAALWLLYQKLGWVRVFFNKMKQAAFWIAFCQNLMLYWAVLLLLAGMMCLFVWIIHSSALSVGQARTIMSVYILSWTAGFVMPGAPGGIGVREFVITYLTRNHPMQEAILLAMVVHRISTVFGDIIGYLWAKCGLPEED